MAQQSWCKNIGREHDRPTKVRVLKLNVSVSIVLYGGMVLQFRVSRVMSLLTIFFDATKIMTTVEVVNNMKSSTTWRWHFNGSKGVRGTRLRKNRCQSISVRRHKVASPGSMDKSRIIIRVKTIHRGAHESYLCGWFPSWTCLQPVSIQNFVHTINDKLWKREPWSTWAVDFHRGTIGRFPSKRACGFRKASNHLFVQRVEDMAWAIHGGTWGDKQQFWWCRVELIISQIRYGATGCSLTFVFVAHNLNQKITFPPCHSIGRFICSDAPLSKTTPVCFSYCWNSL